jgi:hypothetical protein
LFFFRNWSFSGIELGVDYIVILLLHILSRSHKFSHLIAIKDLFLFTRMSRAFVLTYHVVFRVALNVLHLFLAFYHNFGIWLLIFAKVFKDILALLHGFEVAEECLVLRIVELLYILAAHT